MKNKKHLFAVVLLMCLVPVLSGCSYFENAEIQHLKANDKAIEKITNKIIEGSDNNFVEVYEEKTDG